MLGWIVALASVYYVIRAGGEDIVAGPAGRDAPAAETGIAGTEAEDLSGIAPAAGPGTGAATGPGRPWLDDEFLDEEPRDDAAPR